jgi:3-mercaptopyruvate sulfurtransferase SseA
MAKQMSEAGFADVLPLRGGMEAWRDSGKTVDALPHTPPPHVAVDDIAPKAV